MKEIIKIKFKNQIFKIEKEKLVYVLSKLENKEIKPTNDTEIKKIIEKHKLKDEIFLKNINKIWD